MSDPDSPGARGPPSGVGGPAANAQLALLLEVAGTPKPGNVDRERDLPKLRFGQFLGGAVGARPGLAAAADGAPVGTAFERAVAGMAERAGTNTQFGALLLLVPLVRAAAEGDLSPAGADAVVEATTVEDAAGFYRAFDHVDVAVEDPPSDSPVPDVRRGSDAVPDVRDQDRSLRDVMAPAAGADDVAAELVGGFERTFRAADLLAASEGPATARAAAVYLELLASAPDTLVATRHGDGVAEQVMVRAQAAREGDADLVVAFAEALVEEGVNPGTTADIVAAGLFVALERGLEV